MRLKVFNKEKELRKRNNQNNVTIVVSKSSIVVCTLILIIAVMFFTFAKLESKSNEFSLINATVGDFKSGDVTIAAYVNNVKSRSIPAKDSGYYLQKVECENGATGTWDSQNWELTVSNASVQTKCYIYFTTLLAESDRTGEYATLSKYYPIGSIYQTTTNDDPATLFGGCWEQIKDRFLLAKGDTYTTLGSTGGSADAILVSHSHTRGTMEITGTWQSLNYDTNKAVLGAFKRESYYSENHNGSGPSIIENISFAASRSWTGATSSEGESGTGKNMPPYEVVNVYKRITCPSNS